MRQCRGLQHESSRSIPVPPHRHHLHHVPPFFFLPACLFAYRPFLAPSFVPATEGRLGLVPCPDPGPSRARLPLRRVILCGAQRCRRHRQLILALQVRGEVGGGLHGVCGRGMARNLSLAVADSKLTKPARQNPQSLSPCFDLHIGSRCTKFVHYSEEAPPKPASTASKPA